MDTTHTKKRPGRIGRPRAYYRMRGNVRGTKFSRFSRTAWASAKVESANYCGTIYVVIIKWPTQRAVHTLTLQNTTTTEQREQ